MWRLALAVVMLLGLAPALGTSTQLSTVGGPNVSVSFDRRAANTINSSPCIQAQVARDRPYLGSLSISPNDDGSVSFTLSAAGLDLTGTGTLRTSRFVSSGEIRVEESSSLDCPILGAYRIRYYSLY